jgi:predicted transcriptional regulator
MSKQEYIKYLYEKKECTISEIAERIGVSWRTAAKYAKKEESTSRRKRSLAPSRSPAAVPPRRERPRPLGVNGGKHNHRYTVIPRHDRDVTGDTENTILQQAQGHLVPLSSELADKLKGSPG